MSKQLILGTVLGGIVLFVWGAIAWMFIPWSGLSDVCGGKAAIPLGFRRSKWQHQSSRA